MAPIQNAWYPVDGLWVPTIPVLGWNPPSDEPVVLRPDSGEYQTNASGLLIPAEAVPEAFVDWTTCYGKVTFSSTWSWGKAAPDTVQELAELIPALRTAKRKCPACKPTIKHGRKVKITKDPLFHLVQHLNDHHRWTRERIADWLDTLDVDLTFQAAAKGD